jgi:hypothetical protein
MSDMRDEIPEQPEGRDVWRGVVAASAADFADLVPVILPEFDQHLQWGPCRWQPRGDISLPAKGDTCLVMFDNRRDPWIVAWWPF